MHLAVKILQKANDFYYLWLILVSVYPVPKKHNACIVIQRKTMKTLTSECTSDLHTFVYDCLWGEITID